MTRNFATSSTSTGPISSTNKPAALSTVFVNVELPFSRLGMVEGCSVLCLLTRDKKLFEKADAVVFDALYMYPFGPPDKSRKPAHQKWLFNFDFEPPIHNGNRLARGVVEKLAPSIDWTFTFRPNSDFWKPHWSLASKPVPSETSRNWAQNKSSLLLWYSSKGCNLKIPRFALFSELSSYLPPGKSQVYGGCGKRDPCGGRANVDCIRKSASPYKFYAAFENSRCHGYITEKFRTGLESGMVPVVWGGLHRSEYELIAPGDSFIHVDDFSSVKELANFLLELDKDKQRYNAYFAWRSRFVFEDRLTTAGHKYCQVCEELQKPKTQQKPSRSFGNLVDWWYSSCRT